MTTRTPGSLPCVVLALVALIACGSRPGAATPDAGAPAADAGADVPPGDAGPPGKAADPFAALLALPATCSPDQWCWRLPRPEGNDYHRVYATARDNIWLLGQHGTVMQWNGQAWIFHHPPVLAGQDPAQYPFSITGLGPSEMWMIYGTTIVHWNGTTWTMLDSLPTNGSVAFDVIWQAPDGDVWVTVSNGTVRRSHAGGAFQVIDLGCGCFAGSIWGLASDDFFITTLPAGVLHYDGRSFVRIYHGPLVVGSYLGRKDDVWISGASGDAGAMLHWDGATVTTVSTGLPPEWTITGVAAPASNDVWWWANRSSATSAYLHWDGTALSSTPVDTLAVGGFLYSGAVIDGRWWLVGREGSIYTRAGPDTVRPIVAGHSITILDMWGAADDDMYFAGGGEIAHWNGAAMTSLPIEANTISGVRTGGADELFATGEERTDDLTQWFANAFHFDGTTWTKSHLEQAPLAKRRTFTKVFAIGPGEAMAVGTQGMAYFYTNGTWNLVNTGVTTDLVGVWGPDADHLWFTGSHGVLLAWDRANPLVAVPDPSFTATTDDLGPIHGADGITWIGVSNAARAWRSTPAGWTAVPTGVAASGLFAVSATNVVVSSNGQAQVARWNGKQFVPEDTGSGEPTPIVFQPPGGPMLAGWLDALVQHP